MACSRPPEPMTRTEALDMVVHQSSLQGLLQADGIAFGETGGAEIFGVHAGGLQHPLFAKVRQGGDAEVVADLFNGMAGGNELFFGGSVDAIEAGAHDWRRTDAH